MSFAYISGTGAYLPPRVVTNSDLVDVYGIETSDEWIRQRSGIEERRYADEGVGSAELGARAAAAALAQARLDPQELDLIVFATLSPDCAFPGSGVIMQEKLGLCEGTRAKFVPALDVRNQCSGFVYGLSTATAHIRAGMARHVLLVGAETHSGALDMTTRGRQVSTLFGDGAGAVVVSATDDDRGVRDCFLGADGRYAGLLTQRVWDISRRPFIPLGADGRGVVEPEMMWTNMDGRAVFKHAVARMVEATTTVCERQGVALTDIDLFFFHQANLRINQFVAAKLGLPEEKVPHNIERCGNTTAATIPLMLAEATRDGRLQPGMKIVISVFGSGFTWGSALVDW